MNSELQVVTDLQATFEAVRANLKLRGKAAKALDEGGLTNFEILSINSEAQVGTDLQATPEAVLTNLKLPSQAALEGLSLNAEQAASQVTVATAEGFEKLEADAEGNSSSEGWSQPLTRTGKRNRRVRKAKAAA